MREFIHWRIHSPSHSIAQSYIHAPIIDPFAHSPLRPLVHWFEDSLFHWFIDPRIRAFIYPHSGINSFNHASMRWLIRSFIHAFIRIFIHSRIHSYIHSFIRALIDSFGHSFISPCIRSRPNAFIRSLTHPSIRPPIHVDSFTHSVNKSMNLRIVHPRARIPSLGESTIHSFPVQSIIHSLTRLFAHSLNRPPISLRSPIRPIDESMNRSPNR